MTGIFTTALLEWNGMDPVDQDWATLKHHFGKAYEIYITTGNVGNNPYVGCANNAEIINEEDDDSVLTITNVVGNMQMASNAQSQAVREGCHDEKILEAIEEGLDGIRCIPRGAPSSFHSRSLCGR